MKSKIYAAFVVASGLAMGSLQAQQNIFPASGSAGIGTTTPDPSAKLEIKATGKGLLIPRLTQTQRTSIPSPATGLMVYQTSPNPGFYFYDGSDWNNVAYWRRNSNNNNLFYNSGKVGIGTGSPKAQLNIDGGTYVTLSNPGYVIIGNVSSSNMALDYNVIQARNNGSASAIYLNYYGGATYLGTSAAVQISSTGVLTTSGIAGINGASNASYALNVNASSTVGGIRIADPVDNAAFTFSKSGLNYGILVSKTNTSSGVETINSSNAGSGAGIYASSTNGTGAQGFSSNYYGVYGSAGSGGGTSSIGINGYGNYGIYGTTADNSAYYAGYFVGDVYSTTGVYAGSDAKLKQNIKDVVSAMDIIKQLHPKVYNFRSDGNYKQMNLPKGLHYGLIAQDVEKVLPGLVKDSKFDIKNSTPDLKVHNGTEPKASTAKSEVIDFKALNYTELIPLLIKGMQEQQKEIEDLKQQVAILTGNSATDVSSISKTTILSSAGLLQNVPNPYKNSTTIQYYLPAKVSSAQIMITDNSGKVLKQINISGQGKGSVNIDASTLAAGTYNYTLWINGKSIDTKQMVLTK